MLRFSDLPHQHELENEEQPGEVDQYRIIGGDGGDLTGQTLSSDGTMYLIEQEQAAFDLGTLELFEMEKQYFLFNLSNFHLQKLAGL